MATNDKLIEDLSREWDEDKDEYDTHNDFLQPIRAKTALSLNNITSDKGFEFETSAEPESDKTDDKKDFYWTREEIMKHLENNPKPSEDICEEFDVFDERIKHMEDIFENGVFKRVMREGVGERISANSAVLYNLNAYLEGENEPFDSTWLRGRPYLHKLSYDTILPGICKGLMSMRRGERSEFIVRPSYAYLEMGCPPRVPPMATILYIMEVIKVFEEGSLAHFETLDVEERDKVDFREVLGLCDSERISGNSYFKAERYKEAAFRYRRAIRCLEQITYRMAEDEDRGKSILIKLYCNIAITYNKIQKPFNAMSNCKKALEIDRNSAKALYYYGIAKMMNADYDEAKDYLTRALKIKPRSEEIVSALQRLDQRMAGDRQIEENLYRKMGSAFGSSNH